MKINKKILSIPPYISTSWKNVVSLHKEVQNGRQVLVIGLINGGSIEIPNLESSILDAVFAAHAHFLEQETGASQPESTPLFPFGFGEDRAALIELPIKFGLDGNVFQHNSDAANSPDLPKDILDKIATLSKSTGVADTDQFPKPEPHCNCMHCQIMRAICNEEEVIVDEEEEEEEEVSSDDLKFREWDIEQFGEKLFIVRNPFNHQQQYNVFLGSPVGCTCGTNNCEHIRAVLNS